MRRKWQSVVQLVLAGLVCASGQAQAVPLPKADLSALYSRLLNKIDEIKIFDHHAHPGYWDDPDVDAMTVPPSNVPLRLRDTNPELIAAAKALFGYPFDDLAPQHARWLAKKTEDSKETGGTGYFSGILDQLGIDVSVANRAAMASYLDPKRFRWVFFVDSFFFPFDNKDLAARNPDEAVYMPLQEKMLHRYMQQARLNQLPHDFSGYLSFITRILEENQKRGGIAMKLEAAYFRSLRFDDPGREVANAVYDKYRTGGGPSGEDYKNFQDFVFRYLVTEGGRLGLPLHFHSAIGAGDYYDLQTGTALNLENVLRDPRYNGTTFVLIHGGYPYARQSIWLAQRKNVYVDSSEIEFLLYPAEFKNVLKLWLETFPEKVTFGSDAFPYSEALGAEESYWLGVRSSRTALAAALAEMVSEGEVTEQKALEFARGYLHDNAARLYDSKFENRN